MRGIESGGFRNNTSRKALDGDSRTKTSLSLWLLSPSRYDAVRPTHSSLQIAIKLLTKGIEQ